jgi:hypothetical protein
LDLHHKHITYDSTHHFKYTTNHSDFYPIASPWNNPFVDIILDHSNRIEIEARNPAPPVTTMKEIGNIWDLRLQLLMCIKNVGNIMEAIVFKDDFSLSGLYRSLISTAYLL